MALLGQRILGLALGYEDVNDHDELRRDRALSTAMGRVECARSDCEPLAGKGTLNRMELSANGRDRAKARQITVDFGALDELLVELYLVWGERCQIPKRLVLDIDATDVKLHGRQEHRFYHGYYHEYCYLPRLVFYNGWPVRTELRTSSVDVAAGVVETIEPLVDQQFLVVANYIAYPCCGDDSPVLSIELLTICFDDIFDCFQRMIFANFVVVRAISCGARYRTGVKRSSSIKEMTIRLLNLLPVSGHLLTGNGG